jgi:two-component system, OmpR family, sensor histidine kinase ChvG
MSLRFRLLLLSSLTLILPWAGCQYARQMEEVLRNGQEGALLTTAQTLARVLIADSDLVEQNFSRRHAAHSSGKLFAAQLIASPLLDGSIHDWPQRPASLPTDPNAENLQLGIHGAALYVFLRTNDARVRYETPSNDEYSSGPVADRVLILTRDESGVARAWSVSAVAPGPVIARRATVDSPWKALPKEDTDVRGAWRETANGFDIELRIPLRLVGSGFIVTHLDDETAPPVEIEPPALRTASETLRNKLALYTPEGLRISIVDEDGWLLARTGTLEFSVTDGDESPSLYRWLVGRREAPIAIYGLPYGMWGPPVDIARTGRSTAIWFQSGNGEPSTVRAAIPIVNSGDLLGVIAVEQAGSRLLLERDAALARLLRLTMVIAVLVVGAAIVFAARLSRRIGRLSVAAASALSPQGDVDTTLPETAASDELGDLARSYATLLQRFKEYTQYLRTLGSKLSHEFRTPLAIVSSSLENIAAEKHVDQTYVQRAREGTLRLQSILTAMTEATRVEQSIEVAERVEFDLADLMRAVGQAYAQTFSARRFELNLPSDPCPFRGAPELIVQMLDKLVDNAVDFCPPQGRIAISLLIRPKQYQLVVANEGPLLAPGTEHKIFDMLISERTGDGPKPHLGLGLFIVQLIARFHGGDANGRNADDLTGVEFEVRLPRR